MDTYIWVSIIPNGHPAQVKMLDRLVAGLEISLENKTNLLQTSDFLKSLDALKKLQESEIIR